MRHANTLKELNVHQNAEELCVDDYKSEICDKSVKSENNLTQHKKEHGNFKYDPCDHTFDTTDPLGKHMSLCIESLR